MLSMSPTVISIVHAAAQQAERVERRRLFRRS
jgi:hypothetical protein